MTPLLQIKNLSINFRSDNEIVPALKNISFEVKRGEILALVGESGSGKSVTALSLLQLLDNNAIISKGDIIFSQDGKEEKNLLQLNQQVLQSVRGNQIAMIFQEPMTSLNPVFTCGYQVAEAIRLHKKRSAAEAKKETIEWFDKVKLPEPENIYDRYPHQLSGGQRQRVMIAMAMCCKPSLLICDEPTTALDVTVQKNILQLIKDLQEEEKMSVIFITHDFGVVSEISDRVVVLYRGEIVETNTTKELLSHPQHPYTKALLACRPVLHKKGERLPVVSDFMNDNPPTHKNPDRFQEIINPEIKESSIAGISRSQNEVLLRVQNLSVHFPSRKSFLGRTIEYTRAVNDVSFDLVKGETLGLVGESGCGKTTLGRTLLRLIDPTEGTIIYEGTDLLKKSKEELKLLRKNIQLVFQDPYSSLNPRLTIGSSITEPLKVHGLFKNNKQRRDRTIELLEKVNLDASHFNRYPHEFSGGQRQRIVIARALALEPSFIVCDEPVSALDVSVQAQVLNLLNDLKKEFSFTVIFISHDLSVVRYISDRIMVMHNGKIVEEGTADEIWTRPRETYTKNLLASISGLKVN